MFQVVTGKVLTIEKVARITTKTVIEVVEPTGEEAVTATTRIEGVVVGVEAARGEPVELTITTAEVTGNSSSEPMRCIRTEVALAAISTPL